MATRGRPRKPVEKQRRAGNPGRRPLPVPAVQVPSAGGVPPVPHGLATDGEVMWTQLWVSAQSWLSAGIDVGLVEQACQLRDEEGALRQVVGEHGHLLEEPIVTPTGKVAGTKLVANPAVRMLRDVEKSLREVLTSLGLTPTERARLGYIQVKKASVLADLNQRRSELQAERQRGVIDVAGEEVG